VDVFLSDGDSTLVWQMQMSQKSALSRGLGLDGDGVSCTWIVTEGPDLFRIPLHFPVIA